MEAIAEAVRVIQQAVAEPDDAPLTSDRLRRLSPANSFDSS
jgi:hypothetical protein